MSSIEPQSPCSGPDIAPDQAGNLGTVERFQHHTITGSVL